MKFNAEDGGNSNGNQPESRRTLSAGLGGIITTLGVVLALGLSALTMSSAQAAAPTNLFVSQTGLDSGTCTEVKPCATITYALSKAASGATIKVSGIIDDNITITGAITLTTWPNGPAGSFATLDGTNRAGVIHVTQTGAATLSKLTIENGSSSIPYIVNGVGIYNDGTTSLVDSTVINNCDTSYNQIYSDGTMTIMDSTVTDTATNPEHACEAIANSSSVGAMQIFSSTISGNNLGLLNEGIEPIIIGGSIVAGNLNYEGVTSNCADDSGLIESLGYNMTDDATDTPCSFNAITDKVNESPKLGALASHGGPTQTMSPAPSSPATNVIPDPTTLGGVAVCPSTDQRGDVRPGPGETRCTIGSVEASASATKTAITLVPTTVAIGARVIYLVTVAPTAGSGVPTGKITMKTGSVTLCTAALSGGVAACGATTAPMGTDTVTGTYSGGAGFIGSAGTAVLTVT